MSSSGFPRLQSPFVPLRCAIGAHDDRLSRRPCRVHPPAAAAAGGCSSRESATSTIPLDAPICCSLELSCGPKNTTFFLDPPILYGEPLFVRLRMHSSAARGAGPGSANPLVGGCGFGLAAVDAVDGHPKNGIVCGNSRTSNAHGIWFGMNLGIANLTSRPLSACYHYGAAGHGEREHARLARTGASLAERNALFPFTMASGTRSDKMLDLGGSFSPAGPCVPPGTKAFEFFEFHVTVNWGLDAPASGTDDVQAMDTATKDVQIVTKVFGGAGEALTPLLSRHADGALHVTTTAPAQWLSENPLFHFSVAFNVGRCIEILEFDTTTAERVRDALEDAELPRRTLPPELNWLVAQFSAYSSTTKS